MTDRKKNTKSTDVVDLSKVDWNLANPPVEHEGKKIILPNDPGQMDYRAAADRLIRMAQEEEQTLDVHEVIDAFPEDALYAFYVAMRTLYGWTQVKPASWFRSSPDLLTIYTGPNRDTDYVQVPHGRFSLPNVENDIQVGRTQNENGQPCIYIAGTVKRKEQGVLKELADLTRRLLREKSIYKGKAIRLRCDEDGDLIMSRPPEFIDVSKVSEDDLILNPVELRQVQTTIWAPIKHTARCRAAGIPLKRAALLYGPYGTGKTLTANVTASVCEANGWTYIFLEDVRAMTQALLFAQRYQPAVIFAEDAERVAGARDQRGNDLLNTIDGILGKHSDVMVVMTTNHVEKIERAMLRPGRFDSLVEVLPPEQTAVKRLLRMYARDLLDPSDTLEKSSAALTGQIPATIREVVERSKMYMIDTGNDKVTDEDLFVVAEGMKRHMALLQEEKPKLSDEHVLGAAFSNIVAKSLTGDGTARLTSAIHELDRSAAMLMSIGKAIDASNRITAKKVDDSSSRMAKIAEKVVDMNGQVEEIHDAVVEN